MKYQQDVTKAQQPYAIKVADGWEFFSNKRDVKYELRKTTIFDIERGIKISSYRVYCFVLEGDGWVQGNNGSSVEDVCDFWQSMQCAKEFLNAERQWKEEYYG